MDGWLPGKGSQYLLKQSSVCFALACRSLMPPLFSLYSSILPALCEMQGIRDAAFKARPDIVGHCPEDYSPHDALHFISYLIEGQSFFPSYGAFQASAHPLHRPRGQGGIVTRAPSCKFPSSFNCRNGLETRRNTSASSICSEDLIASLDANFSCQNWKEWKYASALLTAKVAKLLECTWV